MEKKNIIIIAILGILIVAGIVFAVVYDNVINDCILEINDVKYTKADFESFLKVHTQATPIAEGQSEKEYIEGVYNNYIYVNMFFQAANHSGIKIDEEISNKLKTNYEEEKEEMDKYGITLDEYINFYGKYEVVNEKYLGNASTYVTITDEIFNEYLGTDKEECKTYDYRILNVSVPEVEKTKKDEEGNDVDLGLSEEEIASKEEENKAEAKRKAEEALQKINNGEDFEEVAKEYGSYRLVPTLEGGYSIANGNLETGSSLILEAMIGDEKLYNEILKLEKGECSELVENSTNYAFIKLEDIREGLDEKEEKVLKNEVATVFIQQSIQQTSEVVQNLPMVRSVSLNIQKES